MYIQEEAPNIIFYTYCVLTAVLSNDKVKAGVIIYVIRICLHERPHMSLYAFYMAILHTGLSVITLFKRKVVAAIVPLIVGIEGVSPLIRAYIEMDEILKGVSLHSQIVIREIR